MRVAERLHGDRAYRKHREDEHPQTMIAQTRQDSYLLADGSEIEFTIRTDRPSIARIFTADIGKRMRDVQLVDTENDTSLAAFRSAVPEKRTDDRRSTTTHSLPAGDVTISIDASGKAVHGYLYHLATAAVAYTHTVDIHVEKASLLAVALLGSALALFAAGRGLLGLPLVAAGVPIFLHVIVYCLSARGFVPSLSRTPRPTEPSI
ncbi:MAG: hypothetical protein ABEJ05_12190 [Haloglomus sp.]